jgi:hypothetical protein
MELGRVLSGRTQEPESPTISDKSTSALTDFVRNDEADKQWQRSLING